MIRSTFSKVSLVIAGALVAMVAIAVADTAVKVDSKLAAYKTVSGVSGNIKSVGSDTMNNLMTLWAEDFRKAYPNVQIEIEGKGSSTAPPALVEGTATFGPMSRTMKDEEVDQFEAKYGYKPTAIRTFDRHVVDLRKQGQPDQVAHHAADRRDLLEDAQGRRHRGDSHLGRPGSDR
jgi:ABC-type phosphate transport system substrate-binding protein